MAVVYPTFQPQNPAKNGYHLGWASCTAYAGAMAASFDRQVKQLCSGEAVRRRTGDTSGGTTLAQIDAALNSGWSVNLSVYYRLPWATFAKLIDEGQGAILQGWYAPIADSIYDAGRGFRGNHAIFVPPNWAVMDPLADGRAPGVYQYVGAPYPRALLKNFAGKLNLDPNGYRALGAGFVYAAFTHDKVHQYLLHFRANKGFWVYQLGPDGKIKSRYARRFKKAATVDCSVPARYAWPGNTSRTLVRVMSGTALNGEYIGIPQTGVKLEVVP